MRREEMSVSARSVLPSESTPNLRNNGSSSKCRMHPWVFSIMANCGFEE
jgi:hypothetical protein